MNFYNNLILAIAVTVLSACAYEPPPKTLHQQVTDLEKSGVFLTISVLAGHAGAVADNPVCAKESCNVTGRGIYVGNGLVVTAAHVVKNIDPGDWLKLSVWNSEGGGMLLWRSLKWGRGQDDLALIRVGDGLLKRTMEGDFLNPETEIVRTPVCDTLPIEQHPVVVVGYQTVFATTILFNKSTRQYNLSNQMLPGMSGSGVVDTEKGCLLAVVSAQNSIQLAVPELDDVSYTSGMQQTLVTPINKAVFDKMIQSVDTQSDNLH